MFSLDGVSVTYRQAVPLRSVTIDLAERTIAIRGPSGSGKSTLLRILAGQQEPDAGTVLLDGHHVERAGWRAASDRRIAFVHQEHRLVEFLTIEQNLRLAAEIRGVACGPTDVANALELVRLDGLDGDRYPLTLSGGEQQRVAIARALVCRSAVLVADEPSGALDAETTGTVTAAMLELARNSATRVVVATHDPSVATAMEACYELHGGTLRRCE